MTPRFFIMLLAATLLQGISTGAAQTARRPVQEFMRAKLEVSKRLMEGLVTGNFELITSEAGKLSAMSKAEGWRAFESPDYEEQSAQFRRQVDSLLKAAKQKSIDSATLAYMGMTQTCVECHKYVRGRYAASLDRPAEFRKFLTTDEEPASMRLRSLALNERQ